MAVVIESNLPKLANQEALNRIVSEVEAMSNEAAKRVLTEVSEEKSKARKRE
jgi:hypothetical protein